MEALIAGLPRVAGIFALAWFAFWPAIPAGLALGLPHWVVILTTTVSYISGVVVVALVGGRIQTWAIRRLGTRGVMRPDSKLGRIWRQYGLPGLGLIAPVTLGAQVGAALGLTLNAEPRRLCLWMSIGGLAWSVVLTVGVLLGAKMAQGA